MHVDGAPGVERSRPPPSHTAAAAYPSQADGPDGSAPQPDRGDPRLQLVHVGGAEALLGSPAGSRATPCGPVRSATVAGGSSSSVPSSPTTSQRMS